MMKPTALLFACSLLLTGCITEVTGPGAREVDPVKQLQALIELGNGYILNGEYARAKESLNKALELDRNSPGAHTAFGFLFEVEGEIELAERHFKKAIRAAPDYTPARNTYGAFLFAQGRYKEAVKQLKVAANDRFYVHRSQVFENLGRSYLRLNDQSSAADAFLRSVQLNPVQSLALLELAEIRFEQRNYTEARDYHQRHKNGSPTSARSLLLCIQIARIFRNQNDEASCSLILRNVFPNTDQYKIFQNTLGH